MNRRKSHVGLGASCEVVERTKIPSPRTLLDYMGILPTVSPISSQASNSPISRQASNSPTRNSHRRASISIHGKFTRWAPVNHRSRASKTPPKQSSRISPPTSQPEPTKHINCTQCDHRANNKKSKMNHLKAHHTSSPVECQQCRYTPGKGSTTSSRRNRWDATPRNDRDNTGQPV